MNATDVLDFWFGPTPLAVRREWFIKDPVFDEAIRTRFGALVEQALAGPLRWRDEPLSHLAAVIVLDQFPRNLFRGQARAFAGDPHALALALEMLEVGDDLKLPPLQRWFAYLPLEHAESLSVQERCVALFEDLAGADPALAGALDYAERHRDVIRRFGRFPHRNAALGRDSTAEERAYLAMPGSGF